VIDPVIDKAVLHLLTLDEWEATLAAGRAWAPPSLATEGFVHCSPDEATALAVANALYADETRPMVALVVPLAGLDDRLVWEEAEPAPPPGVSPATEFPHLYGPVEPGMVDGLRFARRDPAGRFVSLDARPEPAEVLDLLPHPEGGWFRRTWTAPVRVTPDARGDRAVASSIVFLLEAGRTSRWHAVASDELWLWHRGGPLVLELGGDGDRPGPATPVTLGPEVEAGHAVQALVPAGYWQRARTAGTVDVLVSCVVAPEFDFADFRVEPDGA
jgi:predicted cupin superfamily sugar epimerase/uncharacterized protein (DUF952 family)